MTPPQPFPGPHIARRVCHIDVMGQAEQLAGVKRYNSRAWAMVNPAEEPEACVGAADGSVR